jgi:hypothetical protein
MIRTSDPILDLLDPIAASQVSVRAAVECTKTNSTTSMTSFDSVSSQCENFATAKPTMRPTINDSNGSKRTSFETVPSSTQLSKPIIEALCGNAIDHSYDETETTAYTATTFNLSKLFGSYNGSSQSHRSHSAKYKSCGTVSKMTRSLAP